jgi:hypothetical protein
LTALRLREFGSAYAPRKLFSRRDEDRFFGTLAYCEQTSVMRLRTIDTGSGDAFVARICTASQWGRAALSIRDASLSCGPALARVRGPIVYAQRRANHQIMMSADEDRLYMMTVIK